MQIKHSSMLNHPEGQFLIMEPQRCLRRNDAMCILYAKYVLHILYNTAKIKPDKNSLTILLKKYQYTLKQAVLNCKSKITILEFEEDQYRSSNVVVYICQLDKSERIKIKNKADIDGLLIGILEPIFIDVIEVLDQNPRMSPRVVVRKGLFCRHPNITTNHLVSVIEFLEDKFRDYTIGVDLYIPQKHQINK